MYLNTFIQMSDSGILLDSGKYSQQTQTPLNTPTETRSGTCASQTL